MMLLYPQQQCSFFFMLSLISCAVLSLDTGTRRDQCSALSVLPYYVCATVIRFLQLPLAIHPGAPNTSI